MLNTLRVENSPFNERQLKQLKDSFNDLNHTQSQWLNGYLTGYLANSTQQSSTIQTSPYAAASLVIIYATETGNSKSVATTLAETLRLEGLGTELYSMDDFRPADLRKLRHICFVISTHGEGEPPEEALNLFDYLNNARAPALPNLHYRVLALGDRSYPLFCEAGRLLDDRLQELGARAFGHRVDCDVDFSARAAVFNDEIVGFARENLVTEDQAATAKTPLSGHLSLVPSASRWNREAPFSAEITQAQKITAPGSDKDVFHINLSLQDSGLQYQPGDALGVWASNDPLLVTHILDKLQIDASERVHINETEASITQALTSQLEITRLTGDIVTGFATAGGRDDLLTYFSELSDADKRTFVETRQLADLTDEYPAAIQAQLLADILRPLTPRSYSIASSQNRVEDEVHLSVATLRSNAIGVPRQGMASSYLNHRIKTGEKISVFSEPNTRFRLPDKPDTAIILIAVGTGIAPFRSFLQELEYRGHNPDSWLIFGNPHLRTDFLYQREWLRWRNNGLLNRIDTAWSRDQTRKRYVQDIVREQSVDINNWLQRGAHIYICGSLKMGHAVQSALKDVLIQQRAIDPGQASDTLAELRRAQQISKDLY